MFNILAPSEIASVASPFSLEPVARAKKGELLLPNTSSFQDQIADYIRGYIITSPDYDNEVNGDDGGAAVMREQARGILSSNY